MLPVVADAGARLEARVVAAQAPAHRAGADVDVIDGPGVARRQQHVAGAARADGVHVHVVPRVARMRRRVVRFGDRHVAERMPLPHHQPGLDVDLLHDGVGEDVVRAAAEGGQVGVDRVEGVYPRGSLRGDAQHVQIRVVAVAGPDRTDLLVGAVVDDVFALAEADLEDPALPPRQNRLALVALHPEVRRGLTGGHRVEPDQVPGLVDDHRPRGADALVGSEEEVPGGGVRGRRRGDPDGGGGDRGSGAVVLDCLRFAGVDRELLRANDRLAGDREGGPGLHRPPAGADAGADRHLLAFGERMGGQEALAGARGVGAQDPAVRAAARADDVYRQHAGAGRPEEADLALRRGVHRPVLG